MKKMNYKQRTALVDAAVAYWKWIETMYAKTSPSRVLDEGWGYLMGLSVMVDSDTEEALGAAWQKFKEEYEGRK